MNKMLIAAIIFSVPHIHASSPAAAAANGTVILKGKALAAAEAAADKSGTDNKTMDPNAKFNFGAASYPKITLKARPKPDAPVTRQPSFKAAAALAGAKTDTPPSAHGTATAPAVIARPELFTFGEMNGMEATISQTEASFQKTKPTVKVLKLLGKAAINAGVNSIGDREVNQMTRATYGYEIRLNDAYKRGEFVIVQDDHTYFYGLVTGADNADKDSYYVQIKHDKQQSFNKAALAIRPVIHAAAKK